MQKSSKAALLAVAGFAALGVSAVAPQAGQQGVNPISEHATSKTTPVKGLTFAKAMAGIFGGMGSSGRSYRKPGPGWSNAHVKRMARKRRNVIRNRKAHR